MDNIEAIWDRGNEQILKDESLDTAFIKKSISESSKQVTSKLIKVIRFGLILTALSTIMFVYNIFFYLKNSAVVTSIFLLLILSISSIIYLIAQTKKLKKEDSVISNLHQILVNKIKFFTKNFQIVIHCLATSIVFGTMAINLTMENGDGIFELRKILILSVYYIAVYIGIVYLLKKLTSIYLKRLKNGLTNLEKNSLTDIDKEEKKHKKMSRIILIAVLILSILGLIVAYFKGGF